MLHLFAEKDTYDPITNTTIPKSCFDAKRIAIDFPQYVNYERVDELELWIIKLKDS